MQRDGIAEYQTHPSPYVSTHAAPLGCTLSTQLVEVGAVVGVDSCVVGVKVGALVDAVVGANVSPPATVGVKVGAVVGAVVGANVPPPPQAQHASLAVPPVFPTTSPYVAVFRIGEIIASVAFRVFPC